MSVPTNNHDILHRDIVLKIVNRIADESLIPMQIYTKSPKKATKRPQKKQSSFPKNNDDRTKLR